MEEKNGSEIKKMKENNNKEDNKKKIVPYVSLKIPQFSQMQLRAMERKRSPKLITPLLARTTRKRITSDFWERERKANRGAE